MNENNILSYDLFFIEFIEYFRNALKKTSDANTINTKGTLEELKSTLEDAFMQDMHEDVKLFPSVFKATDELEKITTVINFKSLTEIDLDSQNINLFDLLYVSVNSEKPTYENCVKGLAFINSVDNLNAKINNKELV